MSNILATVGRNIQYIGVDTVVRAAIITAVGPSAIELAYFDRTAGLVFIKDAREFSAHSREVQVNVYKLTWHGR